MSAEQPASREPSPVVRIVRDAVALHALRTDWAALEDRAAHYGLYVTCGYVSLAWQHLASPGDELFVLTVHDPVTQALTGVLPLVRVTERHHGLTVRVLRHIGIWEGERPGVLALESPDEVWAAAWRHLVAHRGEWQVLDLRELDDGAWPLRALQAPGAGFAARAGADIEAPWQRLDGPWALHLGLRSEVLRAQRVRAMAQLEAARPGLCVAVAEQPGEIADALARYLALERALVEAGGGVTLGSDPRRAALYRDWLPRLAARGDAAVWLLGGADGEVAGLIRLRCGDVWIERHACYDPALAEHTPSLLLVVEALQRSFGTTAQECDLVNLREPAGAAASVLDWFDDRRPTRRLAVRNLRSVLGPVELLRQLAARLRGGAG